MKKLKMPKNASDRNKLRIALNIYNDTKDVKGGWLSNSEYISKAMMSLDDGVEHEPQFYTIHLSVAFCAFHVLII